MSGQDGTAVASGTLRENRFNEQHNERLKETKITHMITRGTKCEMPLFDASLSAGTYQECPKRHGDRKVNKDGKVTGKISVARYKVSVKPRTVEYICANGGTNYTREKIHIYVWNDIDTLSFVPTDANYQKISGRDGVIINLETGEREWGIVRVRETKIVQKVGKGQQIEYLACADCARKPSNLEKYEFHRLEFQDF